MNLKRFSLRALLITITAFCIVLGYAANWKWQRRRFLAKHRRHLHVYNLVEFTGRAKAPLPRLVGEIGHYAIEVLISQDDTTVDSTRYKYPIYCARSTPNDFATAKRLYPEAMIVPYVKIGGNLYEVAIEDTWANTAVRQLVPFDWGTREAAYNEDLLPLNAKPKR
jgi:hypothetical protein